MASEKILKFVEEIKTLTVLELNELVKAIEEEFGVSAAAPVVMAGGPAAAGPAGMDSLPFAGQGRHRVRPPAFRQRLAAKSPGRGRPGRRATERRHAQGRAGAAQLPWR